MEVVLDEGMGTRGEAVSGRCASVQRWRKAKEVPKALLTGSL